MEEREEAVLEERWLPIPDYEGWYDVSNWGRVRRIKAYNSTHVGRILKQSNDGRGYMEVCLCKNGEHHIARAHRLVMSAFVGLCPEGSEVNHKDGVKTNNHLDNLEYVTRSENAIHSHNMGLQSQRGENNANSILKEDDVHKIRKLFGKETHKAIAVWLELRGEK